jgi:hypothetical protein
MQQGRLGRGNTHFLPNIYRTPSHPTLNPSAICWKNLSHISRFWAENSSFSANFLVPPPLIGPLDPPRPSMDSTLYKIILDQKFQVEFCCFHTSSTAFQMTAFKPSIIKIVKSCDDENLRDENIWFSTLLTFLDGVYLPTVFCDMFVFHWLSVEILFQ